MTGAEIAAITCAVAALSGVIITVLTSASRIGRMSGIMEQSLNAQNSMIGELKNEIAKLGDVLIKMAVERTRLDNLSEQVTQLNRIVDDLRRGEGMILPLSRSIKQSEAR